MELLRKSFDSKVATNYKKKSSDAWGGGVCLIAPDGKILLGLRTGKSEEWCTPGGKVDLGETALEGMVRELHEEAGLKLSPEKFNLADVHIGAFKNDKVWLSFVYYYNLNKQEFNYCEENLYPQKGEIEEWKWCTVEEATEHKLFPPTEMSFNLLKDKDVL